MPVDQKRTIGRVGTPTQPRKTKGPLCKLGHCLAQELSTSPLRLNGDLVRSKRHAHSRAVRLLEPIAVSRVLVAHLELVLILVRLHEESLFDVKQHRQVLEQPGLLGRHLDVSQRPRRRSQLALEVEQLITVRSSAHDRGVCSDLSPVLGLDPLDVPVLKKQRRHLGHHIFCPESLRLLGARNQGLPGMHPARSGAFVQALPSGKATREHSLRHRLPKRLGVRQLHELLVDVGPLTVVELSEAVLGTGGHDVPRVMIVRFEYWVRRPPLVRGVEQGLGYVRLVVALGENPLLDDFIHVVACRDWRWHCVRVDERHVRVSSAHEVQGRAIAPGACPNYED